MLKIMHKYKKSVLGVLVICGVSVIMTAFGVDIADRQTDHYAIKINDTKIDFDDFYRERRQVQEMYRNMYGKNYPQIQQLLEGRLNQQLVDRLVADNVLTAKASQLELYVGEGEVRNTIISQLFPQGFDRARYATYLQHLGMSSSEFEGRLAKDALKEQMSDLIAQAAYPSKREVRAALIKNDTKFDVDYVEFAPDSFKSAVRDPEQSELQKMYEAKVQEFEIPARVAYDYLAFDPIAIQPKVEISPDDIEIYYTDNLAHFKEPDSSHVRHIQFTYPSKADQKKKDEIKKTAQEVRQKLLDGAKFEDMAKQYSSDFATSTSSGDLGWIKPGQMTKEFDAALDKLKLGDLSELVETPAGIQIIKLEDRKAGAPKPLEQVRAQIETELKQRDAPAFAASKAQDAFAKWEKSDASLADFGKDLNLELKSTAGLLGPNQEPAPNLHGITSQIINNPDSKKQLIESGDISVLVLVKELKQPELPKLEQIKDNLLSIYRNQEAKKLAAKAADAAVTALGTESAAVKLAKYATDQKLTLKTLKDIKASAPATGVLARPENLKAAISAVSKPTGSIEIDGKYYLFQVASSVTPKAEDIETKIVSERKQEMTKTSQMVLSALINKYKSESAIDVSPTVYSAE